MPIKYCKRTRNVSKDAMNTLPIHIRRRMRIAYDETKRRVALLTTTEIDTLRSLAQQIINLCIKMNRYPCISAHFKTTTRTYSPYMEPLKRPVNPIQKLKAKLELVQHDYEEYLESIENGYIAELETCLGPLPSPGSHDIHIARTHESSSPLLDIQYTDYSAIPPCLPDFS